MPDTPLRVCMVAPLPPPYGGISHWASMVTRYAGQHDFLHINVVDTAPRWRAIHDLTFWKRATGGLLQVVRDSWRFLVCLRTKRPHVVHLTTSGHLAVFRDLIVMLLARIFSLPVIYHIRFGRVPDIASRATWEWLFMRYAIRKAYLVIAIDSATANAVKRYLPPVKLELVPNCVDCSALPEKKEGSTNKNKFVFIGWVIPSKGIEELVVAWSQLELYGWQLDIIGPVDPVYEEMLTEKYQPERVSFYGGLSHEEAMQALSAADCFVLPSYTEGFPNVVLEAMALGRAIISTNVGAIPEMLAGECGIVVESQSISELRDAIANVSKNKGLRADMGVRAQKKAQSEYSLEVVFEKYVRIWQDATGKD